MPTVHTVGSPQVKQRHGTIMSPCVKGSGCVTFLAQHRPPPSLPHPLTCQGTLLSADSRSSWEFTIKLFAHAWLAQRHRMSKLKTRVHRPALLMPLSQK